MEPLGFGAGNILDKQIIHNATQVHNIQPEACLVQSAVFVLG
jgi:hypothetical protein